MEVELIEHVTATTWQPNRLTRNRTQPACEQAAVVPGSRETSIGHPIRGRYYETIERTDGPPTDFFVNGNGSESL